MKKNDERRKIVVLGATSAIAMATMRWYAARGAQFYLVARDEQKLIQVAADLQVRGASAVHTCVMDLDETSQHVAMLQEAQAKLGDFEIALLAYGVLGEQAEAEKNYAAAEQVLRTNLLSAVSLLTWLGNYFATRKCGTIVGISSVAGDRGRKSNYVYGTTKAGLSTFLQGMRNRLQADGVTVITVKPGFVATPMTAHLGGGILFATPERIGRGIARAIEGRKDVVYLPGYWRMIMATVRAIPEKIFKRLNL